MFKLFLPLLFALLDGNAQDHTTIKDTTDVVEINHVYKENENGELTQRLVQVIWWDWKNPLLIPEKNNVGAYTGNSYRGAGFVVVDFRVTAAPYSNLKLVKKITPRKFGEKWVCLFYDVEKDCFREVTSRWRIISHTIYDREMDNKDIIQSSSRRKLTKPNTYDRIDPISQEVEDLIDRNTAP
tara:strand:- start:704 stop:1252 length:549 start_codon:yes stop_codon:yes gene_type:complete